MSIETEIRGADGMLELLNRLGQGRVTHAARAGLRTGLTCIREEAAAHCPRDTGALQASIGLRMREEEDGLTGEVYAGQAYAVSVEMGTRRSPARPFLYPAFKANEERVKKAVRDAVIRSIAGEGEET